MPGKWTPERRAKFLKTMASKKRGGGNKTKRAAMNGNGSTKGTRYEARSEGGQFLVERTRVTRKQVATASGFAEARAIARALNNS